MAAKFKKVIQTVDDWGSSKDAQGDKIIDAVVNPVFNSVYDGQVGYFPKFEKNISTNKNLNEGQVPIGSTYASCHYLLEFPTITTPRFGSADLYDVELNFDVKDTNYNRDYTAPDVEIYKFKRKLPTVIGTFPDPVKEIISQTNGEYLAERIVVGSGSYSSGPRIFESFDGHGDEEISDASLPSLYTTNPLTTNSTIVYMSLDAAWDIDWHRGMPEAGQNDRSMSMTKNAYYSDYGKMYQGNKIVEFFVDGDKLRPVKSEAGGNGESWWREWLTDDPAYASYLYDYPTAKALDKTDDFAIQYVQRYPTNTFAAEDPSINIASELASFSLDKDNTFFDSVTWVKARHHPTITNEETDKATLTALSTPHFSPEGSPASGQCARMYARTDPADDDASFSMLRKFGSVNVPDNIIRFVKQIPKPLPMARKQNHLDNVDNNDIKPTQLDSMRIRIKTKIISLTKMHKSWPQGTSQNFMMTGNNMLRSLTVMLSTRPPKNWDSLGAFLNRLNTGYTPHNWNDNITASTGGKYDEDNFMLYSIGDINNPKSLNLDYSTFYNPESTNNYNGISIMRVPSAATTSTAFSSALPDEGTLYMFHTGHRKKRINYWDGYKQISEGGHCTSVLNAYLPFVIKNGVSGRGYIDFGTSQEATNPANGITPWGPHADSYEPLENDDTTGVSLSLDEWFYIDAYINHNYDAHSYNETSGNTNRMTGIDPEQHQITWIISSTSDKVIASCTQKHSGAFGDTGAHITALGGAGASCTTFDVDLIERIQVGMCIKARYSANSFNGERMIVTAVAPDDTETNVGAGEVTVVRRSHRDDAQTLVVASDVTGRISLVPSSQSNTGDGFPSYLSIWLNNMQVGKGTQKDGFGEAVNSTSFWESDATSEMDVLIDSISVEGFQPTLKNVSTHAGQGSRGSITIEGAAADTILDSTNIVQGELIPEYLDSDDNRECTPSYITWGAKTDIWTDKVNHIFMGGFECTSPQLLDAADENKRIKYQANPWPDAESDIRFFGIAGNAGAGSQGETFYYPYMGHSLFLGGDSNSSSGPNFNNRVNVGTSYENTGGSDDKRVDTFTKKGFIKIDKPTFKADGIQTSYDVRYDDGEFVARENPLFSTKITKIVNAAQGKIEVADLQAMKAFEDDEFIIYRAGKEWCEGFAGAANHEAAHLRRGLYVTNINESKRIVTLKSSTSGIGKRNANPSYADTTARTIELLREGFLCDLYISPLRYWVIAEIYNRNEYSKEIMPTITYNHSLICDNTLPPDSSILGLTFAESIYSDTTVESSKWMIDTTSTQGLIENKIDYGFGSRGGSETQENEAPDLEAGIGYINKAEVDEGKNIISLKGLVDVEKDRLIDSEEKVTLIIKGGEEIVGSGTILSTKYDGNQAAEDYHESKWNKPSLTYIYKDELPVINLFKVEPYEEDPFYPEYTWETEDDDLWYGFIILDNESIYHQYHKATLHIPMNEVPTGKARAGDNLSYYSLGYETFAHPYDIDGVTHDWQKEPYDATRFHGKWGHINHNLQPTIEGLAGNALYFSGTQGLNRKSLMFYQPPAPTTNFSLITHFTLGSLTKDSVAISGITQQNEEIGYIVYSSAATASPDPPASSLTQYSMWIDSTGNVNANVTTDDRTTTVTLKSTYIVPEGNREPVCAILTVDTELIVGNVKLFINGKLEDQSGRKTTNGSSNNWKDGQNIEGNATYIPGSKPHPYGYLCIGGEFHNPFNSSNKGPGSSKVAMSNFFNGTIEEVVLYNHTIYPVVPSDGKMVLTKPIEELTDNSETAAGRPIVAKLFIKDYHNIRGKTVQEVAQTSLVSVKKAGLGLRTAPV